MRAKDMNHAPAKTVVLVVDNDLQIRRLLKGCLEANGYEMLAVGTGNEALAEVNRCPPDMILLEQVLPDMEGLDLIQRLREWSQIPVLVLSVRDRDMDKVKSLNVGANDYLAKPFHTGELLARMRVVQRYGQAAPKPTAFTAGDLHVDFIARTVKVRGQPVKLTGTEYSLLLLFVHHAGELLTHRQLLRQVWRRSDFANTSSLRVYMTHLRQKIEAEPGHPRLLVTVPGAGYRLEVGD